jgi:hypothetical protein
MSVLGSLARIEASRLLRHPAFMLGLAATALALMRGNGNQLQHWWLVSGQAAAGAGLGSLTFLTGFLAADRVRRDGAGELYAALPSPPALRTGGLLLSLGAAAAAAALVFAAAWLAFVGVDGQVEINLEMLSPNPVAALQAPLIVIAFGALGVCFGRWTPRTALAPLLVIVFSYGPIAWSIPWVMLDTTPWVDRHDWLVGSPGWHLAFLAGIALAAAGLALLRDDRGRVPRLVAASGVALAAAGGVLQL